MKMLGPPKLFSQTTLVLLFTWLPPSVVAYGFDYSFKNRPRVMVWGPVIGAAALALPFVVVVSLQWRYARRLRLARARGGAVCVNCYYEIGHEGEGTTVCPECAHPLSESLKWRDWEAPWATLWHHLRTVMGQASKWCGGG